MADERTNPTGFDSVSLKLSLQPNLGIVFKSLVADIEIAFQSGNKSVIINQFAPPGTRFCLRDAVYYAPVQTSIESKEIMIATRGNYQHLTAYGLLHGISRLAYHDDKMKHERSSAAHTALKEDLSRLRAYGDIKLPKDPAEKDKKLQLWREVVDEEREVSFLALETVRRLLSEGINPFPKIRSFKDLARSIVNSHNLLRTAHQLEISPEKTHQYIGLPMTLNEQEVANVINGFPPSAERPFR